MADTKTKTPSESEGKNKGFVTKQLVLIIVVCVLALAALGTAAYFYMQYQKTQTLLKNPATAAQEESNALIADINKLIVLPKDEVPRIATVSDVNKLKQQAFFAQAKNGDKVLIYQKAQKAILYDPSEKKIIEVGPVNIASSPTPIPTPAAARVALYNGTAISGLTTTTEKQLKEKAPNITVGYKGNAGKSDYTKTMVIDLTGKNAQAAAQVAGLLTGEVSSLPNGEKKPDNVDILVILGQ